MFAKQTRLPYRQYEHTAHRPLWKLHPDMSGIQEPSLLDGYQYFITFIDDYTRHCWVYFTNRKDAKTIRDIYKIWSRNAENKANAPVSYLQTDVGGEYQGVMATLLRDSGTTHLTSAAYSHESNGLVEGQNRTLKDTARALLYQANLPSSLWTKAVAAACEIRNRLPHSSLPNQISPHEAFFGSKPSLSHFKVFGSLAYPHIPEERRPKQSAWDQRAIRFVLVGYPSSANYEIYNFTQRKFEIEHNVDIYEDEFSTPQDFDPSIPTTSPTPTPPASTSNEPKPIYDMIVVQKPPQIVDYVPKFANSASQPLNENPTFEEAIQGPDKDKWVTAMTEEISSIEQNETWKLVKLPPGRKPIGVKWVLTVKRDAQGNITKYKARLVAKGYSQQFGFDFDETYAPFVRIEHVRMLFTIAVLLKLDIIHLDAKNAFLNGPSDFAIYIKQPQGFINPNPKLRGYVLLLLKSLYGLKQAFRIWYLILYQAIIDLGFEPSDFDPCIFISRNRKLLIAIYVDDILAIGPPDLCTEFAKQLGQQFRISNQGNVSSFLGINIQRSDSSILLNQIGYINKLAARFRIESCNPTMTPIDYSLPLLKADQNDKRADATLYKELIGSLNHLAIFTRPDISLAVSKLSQFNQDPSMTHLKATRRICLNKAFRN